MCVYIFGCLTFQILEQALLHWIGVCFFTWKYCYLLLFIIHKHYCHFHYYFYYYCYIYTVIYTVIITVLFILLYCNYLPVFTIATIYILTLYWFQTLSFFTPETLCYHIFLIFKPCSVSFFSPIAFRLSQLTARMGGELK